MGKRKATNADHPVAVIDAETDPFLAGRAPSPFLFGFFDGNRFLYWWGPDCVERLVHFLRQLPPTVVYAHNGGKFDFMFLLDALENPIQVIGGRIAKAKIGRCELRDSWSILPFALDQFDKGEIDYAKFESEVRDSHRSGILEYLQRDCRSLWTLVTAFRGRFGERLTVGSSAIAELRSRHELETGSLSHDRHFRQFYFGGRVQCFETGHLHGNWSLLDVNSMYPYVMSERWHPHGRNYSEFEHKDAIRFVVRGKYPWFGILRAPALGAFPVRDEKTGKLEFPATGERRTFFITSHEWAAARYCGLIDPSARFEKVWQCENRIRFDRFVKDLYEERIEHRNSGRRALELGAKFVLNSAYGKFAQNPENFEEFHIRRPGDPVPHDDARGGGPWAIHADYGASRGEIWSRPVQPDGRGFFDVATAASITGAARAVLMRAIHAARRPLYCDTDSLVCEAPGPGMDLGDALGAWKIEATAGEAIIAARKLYSLWDGERCVKSSAKGIQKAELTKSNWRDLIRGVELEIANSAPCMNISGKVTFTRRKVRYVSA